MERNRRLLILPSWYPPDGGQFFQDQAEAIAERGYAVDVLVNRLVGLTRLRYSERSSLRRFSVSTLNNTRVIRSFCLKIPRLEIWNLNRWARSTRRLFGKYVRRFGLPDLIIAHSSIWAGYAAAQISGRWGIPYLVVEHRSRFTLAEGERRTELLKPAYTPYLMSAFSGAKQVITVSDAMQPTVLNYLEKRAKFVTIPNLVDTSFFTPGKVIPGGEGQNEFRILSVGRLDRDKGMDLLIEAFSRLTGNGHEFTLTIVGCGPELGSLREQVAELGVEDRVTFAGKKPPSGVLEELQKASLFALASRMEAFGVVFIEAMAVGLPVVATRSAGAEFIIPGYAGEVVERENVEQLRQGLETAYRERSRYDAGKIRQYVIENFSREVVSREYDTLINHIFND